ncbi:2-dehydropantoate 2-reductase [Vermiculatibacterium agrestimuris]|uniref:2-dehydropantoate 2-reductase n=1 Tax=Vermiculatibacterium agrestimuris TaxID=2941519 RepID=UPI00203FC511|nr:2-dehydropantoate 2-reductase [Vermiculatibacterium agrestimuris]
MEPIQKVAVIGLGALGTCYADQILRGDPTVEVRGVLRPNAVPAPIFLNGIPLKLDCRPPAELTDFHPDLILVAVKSYDLEEAIQAMAPLVGPHTLLLSLLNGMESEDQLAQAFGPECVLCATVVGADTNRNQRQVHCQSSGVILFGERDGMPSQATERLEEFVRRCGLTARRVDDITYQMWYKLMVNAGFNQASTVYQLTYGQFRENREAMEVMRYAQQEVCALARQCGVVLGEQAIQDWEHTLARLSPEGRSSMLQDYWMGRRLETDIFGDYVTRLGQKLGVPTPVSDRLNAQIKQMEHNRDLAAAAEPPRLSTGKLSIATPKKIASQIRIDIVKQKYKAGDKLVETQLAEQYGASRSSVRTALQILSGEGLIIIHSNGRREVVAFSEQQVKNLYDFRWLIENRAVEMALEKSGSVYPKLAEILGIIEDCCTRPAEEVDWYDLDVRFHRALVASAENIFLSNAWESNAEIFYTLMNFNTLIDYSERYAAEFFEKHRHIYELLLSRDRRCLSQLEQHILDAENIANSVLECFGAPR